MWERMTENVWCGDKEEQTEIVWNVECAKVYWCVLGMCQAFSDVGSFGRGSTLQGSFGPCH